MRLFAFGTFRHFNPLLITLISSDCHPPPSFSQSLTQYADLFWGKRGQGYGRERIHFTLGDAGTQARLEVVLAVSASAHLEARGMVNGVLCSQGTHVEFVVNKVTQAYRPVKVWCRP